MTILHHAGICVRDMAQSLRFYRDGLELAVLIDTVLNIDLGQLLGVPTESVRTVFLGDPERPDAGIVELIDLGVAGVGDGDPQPGGPTRGLFLLSVQVDIDTVLPRLESLGLGGIPRTMPTPGNGIAATVIDPDGVMVELLPKRPLTLMSD